MTASLARPPARILLDCDPGHDDAMAIVYAARRLDLVGITTVFGNTPLAHTTRNALAVCELIGLTVPVAAGMAGPLLGTPASAAHIHGRTGLDGAVLPEPRGAPHGQHAVAFLIEQARAAPGELTLVAVGPLTNVAVALRTEPRLAGWLREIVLMGGSTDVGNITPQAEFNIHCDPEAAAAVFASGAPVRMVGLNVTRQAGIGPAHVERLAASGGPVGRAFAGLLAFYLERTRAVYGRDTAAMHDPCALLALTEPDLLRWHDTPVHVELASPALRGMTACDLRGLSAQGRGLPGLSGPAVRVAVGIDGAMAVDRVVAELLACDR